MLLRWDIEHPGQLVSMPTPMPTWDGVEYVESCALPTAHQTDPDGSQPAGCGDADLDQDQTVGINDLLLLLQAWGTTPNGPPDIDGDGVVGFTDFLALLGYWGPCP